MSRNPVLQLVTEPGPPAPSGPAPCPHTGFLGKPDSRALEARGAERPVVKAGMGSRRLGCQPMGAHGDDVMFYRHRHWLPFLPLQSLFWGCAFYCRLSRRRGRRWGVGRELGN